MVNMDKEKRQQKLLSLIRAKPVSTQGELASHLERAGFAATQSSISRDLEELGVVKRRGRYSVARATDGAAARGLVSLDVAGDALVVARCEPGLASAVAVEIDGASIKEIVGTIAGEDTIFVAVGERKAQRAVIKKIWELFG
ncbi:MAG: transcriptional regulator of arginine metabolism [Pyrinomonadaceae bacterium]|jgi:transcriptional regulator of arginine metabolism|nr:transcriptional regulator of arginine metabolism [Pyrinomonadaceae bacterium]